MSQPYSLRMERSGSGGKPQISVHATMAHHLASRILLQKQSSLDDRKILGEDRNNAERGKIVKRQGSVESADKAKTDARSEPRLERKIKNSMISLVGALAAVEQGDLDALKVILSKNSFSVNDPLESGIYGQITPSFTLLDVALLQNRQHAAMLLLQHGASENPHFVNSEDRCEAINSLLKQNEERLAELKRKENFSKDEEKRFRLLTSHCNSLKKMKNVMERQEFPGPPTDVTVQVASRTRVTLEFGPPTPSPSSVVVLKYRGKLLQYNVFHGNVPVEWSKTSDFRAIAGLMIVNDMRQMPITVSDLEHGESYSFRVSAGSMWGFGVATAAFPRTIRISSWDDVEGCKNSRETHSREIAELYEKVEKYRQSPVWQRVFPNSPDLQVKKKKIGLRNLFSASSKFVKNVQRGIYLASVVYTEDKVLCTFDDCLPILMVDESCTSVSGDDMNWIMKLSMCWDQVSYLQDSVGGTWPNSSQLRGKILEAVASMHNALGVRDIGRVHHVPLSHGNAVFLVTVHFVTENSQTVQGLAMRWIRLTKLIRKKQTCAALDFLCNSLVNLLNFFESINAIRVTVPENLPSVLPFVAVRQNPHVSYEEWEWLAKLDEDPKARPTSAQYVFHEQLNRAVNTLLHDLEIDSDLVRSHRLYRLQVLRLHSDVSFILVLPKPEEVCLVNASSSAEDYGDHFKGCTSVPVPVFQMINLYAYQPDFIAAYCRLSVFFEHFIMVMQYEQRQCLLENDAKVYAEQLEKLQEYQQKLDEVWRSSRWISNIASDARHRQQNCSIQLDRILVMPFQRPSEDPDDWRQYSHVNGSTMLTVPPLSTPPRRRGQFPRNSLRRLGDRSASEDSLLGDVDRQSAYSSASRSELSAAQVRPAESVSSSQSSVSSDSISTMVLRTAVVRVYAAYECGVAKGTSVRLRVNSVTTAAEVIKLVTEQFSKIASSSKLTNGHDSSAADEFCLVVVVGARERRLRDDFPLMQLQKPWTQGKMFVRHTDCVLSAIQHYEAAV
ncbi:Protein R07E4.1 a [Aphelenchoides avenae]|nr:Protein R07E4.1 a [Aphelenchus avenae]